MELTEIHEKAKKRFDSIYSAVEDERRQCLEDRRFVTIAGAQWEGALGEQYANRYKGEFSKIGVSVKRMINENRHNKTSVYFFPDKEEQQDLADVCTDLMRADEQDSSAQEAFDNAYDEAVKGGLGAWRLRAAYEDEYDEENDNMRVRFDPIYDADTSVYFDTDSQCADKSDAKFAFIIRGMSPETFKDQYGDDPASWPKQSNNEVFDWSTPDKVYVAEYYEIEEKAKTKIYFSDVLGNEFCKWERDLKDGELEEMAALGTTEIRRRRIKQKQVHKYIMSGNTVLEDCGVIAGKEIPIVLTYGARSIVEGIERICGHVRAAKDPTRLSNMIKSKLAEISATSSVEKPIFTPAQMKGNDLMWAKDAIEDYPYLLINAITDIDGNELPSPPIGYTRPATIPPAMAALIQTTETDVQDLLGTNNQGEDMDPKVSGVAVEMLQAREDALSYLFRYNLGMAKKRSAQIWLSIAKDIYIDDEREMKIVDAENKASRKKINIKKMSEKGEVVIENNIPEADFGVSLEIGPTSSSKRSALVKELGAMRSITQDPENGQILEALQLMNMEGEGLNDAREFYRKKLVTMGVIEPNEEDEKRMEAQAQNAKPSPNDAYLLAAAEKEKALAKKNEADTIQTIADAELKQAQAAKIMSEVQQSGMPAPVQQVATPPHDYREEELTIKAKEVAARLKLDARELARKERETAIKEAELELKKAEAVLKIREAFEIEEPEEGEDEEEKPDLSATIVEAIGLLKESVDSQKETGKAQIAQAAEALKILEKPKRVIRENGRVVGVET